MKVDVAPSQRLEHIVLRRIRGWNTDHMKTFSGYGCHLDETANSIASYFLKLPYSAFHERYAK